MKNIIAKLIFGFCFLPISTYAQNIETDSTLYNGGTDSLINIVIIADGYRIEERAKFKTDVQKITSHFINTQPFTQYQNYFNVFGLFVASKESGVNHPQNTTEESCKEMPLMVVDNYFGSTFDDHNIHRALYVPNHEPVFRVLADYIPEYDVILVLSNTTYYGGTGGRVATATMHKSAGEIFIHELGHTFAKLCDEYSSPYPGFNVQEAPNCTQITKRDKIKWTNWIDKETPVPTPAETIYKNSTGLFEGANYHEKGWYRPQENCKMLELDVPFCRVCRQELIKKIHSLTLFGKEKIPNQTRIDRKIPKPIAFSVPVRTPLPNTLKYSWTLNNVLIPESSNSYILPAESDLPVTVKLSIRDTTQWIRDAQHTQNEIEEYYWIVRNPNSIDVGASANILHIANSPADEYLDLSLQVNQSAPLKLVFYDLSGKRVGEELLNLSGNIQNGSIQNMQIPTGYLANGLYVIQLISSSGERLSSASKIWVYHP